MSPDTGRFPCRLTDPQRRVLECLAGCARRHGTRAYLVGGAVRDMLMGAGAEDLDLAVQSGACCLLRTVRRALGAGTVIALGEPENDTARLVYQGLSIDVSGYRKGAVNIEQDLALRDFTINSMAVELEALLNRDGRFTVIDPMDGCRDLGLHLVRGCPGCFDDDPLRLLRAYRFSAQLNFRIDDDTRQAIEARAGLLCAVAAERIGHELDLVMASPRAYAAIKEMQAAGLLEVLVPELSAGRRVTQPPFHHLDVMEHNLKTLDYAERIIGDPCAYFGQVRAADFSGALANDGAVELKWAALLHDVGKPATREIDDLRDGRITFYNHDERGVDLIVAIAQRLRWSGRRLRRVAALVRMHMHPFHLTNVLLRNEKLSSRARLKLCRRAGGDLTLLFMLAMADSLAGQGPEKPPGIERELASLFRDLAEFYAASVKPVIQGPKLLTGHDLIATFGLEPGPLIGDLLEEVETAAVEGLVSTRGEALSLVGKRLAKRR
ncbi:MAG: HD domain-containing protein [Desulfofustis sp.]|nr:HD domain-containing protein [Desulfofustis sp.]